MLLLCVMCLYVCVCVFQLEVNKNNSCNKYDGLVIASTDVLFVCLFVCACSSPFAVSPLLLELLAAFT